MEAFAETYTEEDKTRHIEAIKTEDFENLDEAEAEAVFLLRKYPKSSEEVQAVILKQVSDIVFGRFESGLQKEKEIREISGEHRAPSYAKAMIQGFFERLMLQNIPSFVIQEMLTDLMKHRGFEDFNEVIKGCLAGAQSVCSYVKSEKAKHPDEILATHLEVDVSNKIDVFKIGREVGSDGKFKKVVTFVQIKSSEQKPEKIKEIQRAHQKYLSMRVKAEKVINTEGAFELLNEKKDVLRKTMGVLNEFSKLDLNQTEFDKMLRIKSKELEISPILLTSLHRLKKDTLFKVYKLCGMNADENQSLIDAFKGFTESPFETNKFHSANFPDSVLSGYKYYSQVVIGSKYEYEAEELDNALVD